MKILIVEDDAVFAQELAAFLARWNYAVVIAQQFDAIDQEFMACSPQLVLMDINLPFCDGFYWCSRIRQNSKVLFYILAAAMMIRIKLWR